MNRFVLSSFVLSMAVVSTACDKGGLYPYGRNTDIVDSCGPDSAVYLRSTPTGTEILIVGSKDPDAAVSSSNRRCLIDAVVDRDSSTRMNYGTYSLNSSGDGEFHVSAQFDYRFEPEKDIGSRNGAQRLDYQEGDYVDPISLDANGDQLTFDSLTNSGDPQSRTYTSLGAVYDAIDVSTEEGKIDLYQYYQISLFVGQVRIAAFGGLGMTRYIAAPGRFDGLVAGDYSISVGSIASPTATIRYNALEDFPLTIINGTQVTKVDIKGNGPMEGALSFEIRDPEDDTLVRFAGSVDYKDIVVTNGVAASGTYTFSATTPTAFTMTLPYTYAANVDLRHALPVAP